MVIVFLVAQIRGWRAFFCYDHKTLCHILHIFLTRSMQTSSSIVVETTPWPSIMIVATMIVNGISAPNFTMNATKFHITMPRKLSDGRQKAHAHSCCRSCYDREWTYVVPGNCENSTVDKLYRLYADHDADCKSSVKTTIFWDKSSVVVPR